MHDDGRQIAIVWERPHFGLLAILRAPQLPKTSPYHRRKAGHVSERALSKHGISADVCRSSTDKNGQLVAPSPSTVTSPQDIINPSPVASTTGTEFSDVDGLDERENAEELTAQALTPYKASDVRSPDLKVCRWKVAVLGRLLKSSTDRDPERK